jgi:hypothetical protein
MAFKKIRLSILVSILTLLAQGQDSSKFTVTLKSLQDYGRQPPQLFDTIFLNPTFTKTSKIYTNVQASDKSFAIPDVPIGKYWLLFSTKLFCVTPVPIVVCSKCDNEFLFITTPKKQGDNCNLFEMVEVSPSYIGENKALSKDFKRSLNKKEKKKLKLSSDFNIHFFLTKQGILSDLSFAQSDLPQEIKYIILKGLTTVTNWRPAIRNGKTADFELILSKKVLLND